MYKNVLNNVVKVSKWLTSVVGHPSIAIRIMEDHGSCYGGNINNYPWLN
jgi:hypothetical protein